ncbi:MAG: hypothetical protein IJ174_09950 [Clostridia bacterium]|nr:hypothetical protein [Clostridia bacterium]
MKTDEGVQRLRLVLSALSLLFGLLGVFVTAWFAIPGLIAGAVPIARAETRRKAVPGQKGARRLTVIFSTVGFLLSAVTLIALAVNMTAALSR